MNVELTILVENTTPVPPFIGEYGFALLASVDGKKVLFDTGSAGALLKNSEFLGVKLDEITTVAISHGHFDHTGALLPLLEKYGEKDIYAHSGIFVKRPMNRGADQYIDIGCPFSQEELTNAGAKFIFTDNFTEIFPGLYFAGEIPRMTDYEDVGGDFKVELEGKLVNDTLPDDTALVIDHPDGLIIISGCAHAGIINIIDYACKQTSKSKVQAFIGGTHLMAASEDRMEKTIEALRSYNISKIIVSHCTGFYAAARLYNDLGSCVIKGETGMTFKF